MSAHKLIVSLMLCWVSTSVLAQAHPRPMHDWPMQKAERREMREMRDTKRDAFKRDEFVDADSKRDRQRLSPEERRQLRRDINNAGKEFYPRGPDRSN